MAKISGYTAVVTWIEHQYYYWCTAAFYIASSFACVMCVSMSLYMNTVVEYGILNAQLLAIYY